VTDDQHFVLRLYVAGKSPKSLRARSNLDAICRVYLMSHYELEIVDILEEPLRLIQDEIPATPALLKLAPHPAQMMLGDLSDHSSVITALGLTPRE
jgi:circadian clock protein KaiB